jgi:hypothetical protein
VLRTGPTTPTGTTEEVVMTHTTAWTVEVFIYDGDDHTTARAALVSGAGPTHRLPIEGTGRSTRNPADTDVPEIGEEVAAARALRDLADRLLAAASADIAEVTHAEVHLTH